MRIPGQHDRSRSAERAKFIQLENRLAQWATYVGGTSSPTPFTPFRRNLGAKMRFISRTVGYRTEMTPYSPTWAATRCGVNRRNARLHCACIRNQAISQAQLGPIKHSPT